MKKSLYYLNSLTINGQFEQLRKLSAIKMN